MTERPLIDYVACPGCGEGNLSDDDGIITCDNCDFTDDLNNQEDEDDE